MLDFGPTFWNVGYGGVLRFHFPPQVTPIALADDLALVVTHADLLILQTRINESLAIISHWMQPRGLSMSPAKSVAIFLNGRKRPPDISITLDGCPILTKPTARYLGYILYTGLTSKPHLIQAATKAQNMAMAISRILPRVRGAPTHDAGFSLPLSIASSCMPPQSGSTGRLRSPNPGQNSANGGHQGCSGQPHGLHGGPPGSLTPCRMISASRSRQPAMSTPNGHAGRRTSLMTQILD